VPRRKASEKCPCRAPKARQQADNREAPPEHEGVECESQSEVVDSVGYFIAEMTHQEEEPRHLAGLKNADVDCWLPCRPRHNTREI